MTYLWVVVASAENIFHIILRNDVELEVLCRTKIKLIY